MCDPIARAEADAAAWSQRCDRLYGIARSIQAAVLDGTMPITTEMACPAARQPLRLEIESP